MTLESTIFVVAESCLAFFGALLACLYLTPVMRSRAQRWGFVDRPDGARKVHGRPISLGGGLVVLASALIAIGFAFAAGSVHDAPLVSTVPSEITQKITRYHRLGYTDQAIVAALDRPDAPVDLETVRDVVLEYEIVRLDREHREDNIFLTAQQLAEVLRPNRRVDEARVREVLASHVRQPKRLMGETSRFYFGLLASSVLVCLVGVVDDWVGLRGIYKLLGQIVAALLLIASGLVMRQVALFDQPLALGILAWPFTLFWLLGAINAINLLDGMDGLASSVGVVLCLTLAALALMNPRFYQAEAFIALAMAGALVGFLRFNFAPASIFLGDSGSMVIGLVIGAIAIQCSFKEAATVGLAVPLALWAIPILDSLAAILRRKLTGRSLFATDRGHLHHSLLIRGWSVQKVVVFVASICAVTCAGALISYYYQTEIVAWITVLGVVGFLIVMGIFGHIEFALVRDRVRSTAKSLGKGADGQQIHKSLIRLQGSREWDNLWTALVESAGDYDLVQIELTLNLPALHEAFYANWKKAGKTDTERMWRLTSPVVLEGQTVGNLLVAGVRGPGAGLEEIGQIADFLDPIEENIRKVVTEIADAQSLADVEHDRSAGVADSASRTDSSPVPQR